MDATLILIDSDAELLRARALVDQLWNSNDPADVARLEAQARLIAAYEEMKWPHPPSVADLIRLMDQHGLTRADLIPLLGTPSRVSEVMRGKKGLSMAMVQRLRARFRVPADLLLPPPKKSPPRRSPKRRSNAWTCFRSRQCRQPFGGSEGAAVESVGEIEGQPQRLPLNPCQ